MWAYTLQGILLLGESTLTNNALLKLFLLNMAFRMLITVSTPCDPHVPLSHPPAGDTDAPIPHFPYQEIVGSLLYLATHSTPNIAHAVSVVAQYASNFREIHCTAVKRILKYLRGTTILLFATRGILPNLICSQLSRMLIMLVT